MIGRLPQSQRFNNRSINPTGDGQSVILLVLFQGISSCGTKAAIDSTTVVSFPGQCCLDLAHACVSIAAVVFRIFARRIAIVVVTVVIIGIRPVRVIAVSIAPGIQAPEVKPGINEYPCVVVPTAPVATPKVIAAPVPILTRSRHDTPLTIKTLRAKSRSASSRELRTRRRISSWVKSGRAIYRELGTRGRVHSVAKRRLRGEARG